MKSIFVILFLTLISFYLPAQENITRSIKYFGAKGDGYTDDQDAFVKASAFFNNRKGHGKLIIPKGVYMVGRQKFTGDDIHKNTPSYTGENVLNLKDCHNLIIEGNPGAVIKCNNGLRIGTFSPVTGKPFNHQMKDINIQPAYAHYSSTVGVMMYFANCSNVRISGLKLDGNFDKFILGGNWGNGRNPFEMAHYGIYLLDTYDVSVTNCIIEKFACDGIYLVNIGQEIKTYKINIDKCKVNYCGRNGLSWLGGENIHVTNCEFSNSGQGLIHESPGAGIDIEVENNSFCRKGYFYNCTMVNNVGSAITSGSGRASSNVLFKKCIAASPSYYTVFADAVSHVFEDCTLSGTVLVWCMAKSEEEAVKFKRCIFDENYKGKKMYDGNYQLGAEAAGMRVDSCTFKAYTTSSYYLAGHAKDCDRDNVQMFHVSNSSFYNYCATGFKPSEKVAGNAGHTIFYNNRFYSRPGVNFQNGFNANCNADAGKNQFLLVAGH